MANDLAMTVNYDPDLQISSISHVLPQAFDEGYTYDDNGNRRTSLTNSFFYDDLNKLTESTTHEYTYDDDGNMLQERNKLTTETKKYYWDSENRMIKYEHLASDISPVDTTALYKYDIYGRRIQKNVNDTITNFMWEGDNLSLELNSTNQPIRKYFTESHKWVASLDASPSLGIVMRIGMDDYFAHLEYSEVTNWGAIFDTYTPQGWYGYIKDQVGTIYKVWDLNAKALADVRTYDSFGNLISQTGATKTPLGFQGKYYDQESGLNYFYHRYYNPSLGRFISEDPVGIGGGLNFYGFVGNNPVNAVDYLGEMMVFPQGLRPCGYPEEPYSIKNEKKSECKLKCTKQSWAECYYNCINALTGRIPEKIANSVVNRLIQNGIQSRLPTECSKIVFQSSRSVASKGILIIGAWVAGSSYGCMISCLLSPCNW